MMVDKFGNNTINLYPISDEEKIENSSGEVTVASDVDYEDSLKITEGGIFDPEIFDMVEFEEVEDTDREFSGGNFSLRMGHYKLPVEVFNPIFYKDVSVITEIPVDKIREIVMFVSYMVFGDGKDFKNHQIISYTEYKNSSDKDNDKITVLTGATAIKRLLNETDVSGRIKDLDNKRKSIMSRYTGKLSDREEFGKFLKGLSKSDKEVISDYFLVKDYERAELFDIRNTVFSVMPIASPEIRKQFKIRGEDKFVSDDLNWLYILVILRGNRYATLKGLGVPEIIDTNERRRLQDAVNAVIWNEKETNKKSSCGRVLNSLFKKFTYADNNTDKVLYCKALGVKFTI